MARGKFTGARGIKLAFPDSTTLSRFGGALRILPVEGIGGKAVTREFYERVSAVGIAVVLLLFFISLSNDIGRLGN